MERRSSARPQRVLVVDDSADIRELWREWLLIWGFSVEEARNGNEALERARQQPPALILMDLWMPGLDGLEAMRQLKADVRTASVPVIALSAQDRSPTSHHAKAAGADAFVGKPCDPDVLLGHIRVAMARMRPA